MNVIINGVEYKAVMKPLLSSKKTMLGDTLKAYRLFSKVETLEVASKGIGISKSYLWEIEKHSPAISLPLAIKLANYYGFSLEDYRLADFKDKP